MSNAFTIPKFKAYAERVWGTIQLYRAYSATKDETTNRIKQTIRDNPWAVYPDSSPESGKKRYYSSLQYISAKAAQNSFARTSHSLVYGRDGTPDGDTLTQVLLQLDLSAVVGRVTGHGMAAIESALLGVKANEHIVASKHIFGTTKKNLLDLPIERGVTVTFIDGQDPAAWEAAIIPGKTRMFLYEPLGNPGMERIDTSAVAAIAHKDKRDILVVADNSMTPLDQSLSKGADIVAFSTTKLLGNGIDNGGAVLLSNEGQERMARLFPDQPVGFPILVKTSRKGLTQTHRSAHAMLDNAAISIFRFRRQTKTAVKLARSLSMTNPKLKIYSSALDDNASSSTYSPLFSLDLGSVDKAFQFIDALAAQGIGIVNNFGSSRTTAIHPSTTTQSSLSAKEQAEQGISPGLVRISIGIERLGFLEEVFARALTDPTRKFEPYSKFRPQL